MKYSLDISHFTEVSNLSHSNLSQSIVFFYFPCIIHLRRLSYLSLLFSETPHSVRCIFPFLPFLSFFFFPQLFVNPPQTTILPSCISFCLGWFWSLPPVQCYEPLSIVLHTLWRTDLVPWISLSPPLYKGHDLGGTDGKASAYNAGDLGSIPGSGRSAAEWNGNPLQYYCLENPMDRGAW